MALPSFSGFGFNSTERGQDRLQKSDGTQGEEFDQDQSYTARTLPSGFPAFLDSELAWTGSKIPNELEYSYYLTQDDKVEIDTALEVFKTYGLDGDLVDSKTFPLPNLQYTLRKLSLALHNGRGFFIIKDLDYERYSVEDNTVIFLGVQSYIAEKRARQDEKGNMIVHVITEENTVPHSLKEFHIRHSKSSIPFHTDDRGDILAFQTRSTARRGGNCILSPTFTIYNELVTTRPDVIRTLSESNWPLHIPFYHLRPLLFYEDSRIIFTFSPTATLGSKAHPRPMHIPSVSPCQLEALILVQNLAEKHKITLSTNVGDMHFFNNLALLHQRDATEVKQGSIRHLVRMYLRNEALAWKIPKNLDEVNGWKEAYRQDDDVEQIWHIEPMPDDFFPLRRCVN